MTPRELRKAERKRLVRRIVVHIDEFPRQHNALVYGMETFGADFERGQFKHAFETNEDMEAYSRVQAIERAVGRLQGFVGDMARDGVRLADLPRDPPGGEGFRAKNAFEALRRAKVIDGNLCRRLVKGQDARVEIEHEYVRLRAGKLHEAAISVRDASQEFFALFRAWIEPYLD
jgi:hypothetical protein